MANAPHDIMTTDWKFYVTLLGVVASIYWNWKNWERTSRIESAAFTVKRWDDLKGPILSALELFVREASLISKLPMLKITKDLMVAKLNEYSQSVALAHDDLSRKLSEADKTQYANGSEWESLAEGISLEQGNNWDLIVDRIAKVQENPDCLQLLSEVQAQAAQISECVMAATRAETRTHDPAKKK